MSVFLFLGMGLGAGVLSGLLGIGGGILVIPAWVYFGGLGQKSAQGTSLLMMLPPIGLFAAWEYLKRGEAEIMTAVWLCAGFMLGGFLGARWSLAVPEILLRRFFAVFLIAVGLHMLLKKRACA
ncbi:MAG: sulfite exporter TauE/SafE family protein, partial [Candidatus Firestonebacteria bacterium]|nr:sulfite exporter TauE/SafE family protein [Candidatus Firestonebacteria bacterium]